MIHAYIPQIQIRHNCLIAYDLPIERDVRTHARLHDLRNVDTYTGSMSAGARKRVEKAVDILLQKSPTRRIFNPVRGGEHDFRINFLTLTIADLQNHSAREGYDLCLKPFLRIARKKWKVEDYIWKAELQQRGQLHYHLTTNQFIHLEYLNHEWNKIQKKAGWLNDFARRHGHFNPNSTDIHAVWKVKNLAGYLCKYIAKNIDKNDPAGKLNGKVWDCSNSLKIDRYSTELTQDKRENLEDAAQQGIAKINHLTHCTIISLDNPTRILDRVELKDYHKHIS